MFGSPFFARSAMCSHPPSGESTRAACVCCEFSLLRNCCNFLVPCFVPMQYWQVPCCGTHRWGHLVPLARVTVQVDYLPDVLPRLNQTKNLGRQPACAGRGYPQLRGLGPRVERARARFRTDGFREICSTRTPRVWPPSAGAIHRANLRTVTKASASVAARLILQARPNCAG